MNIYIENNIDAFISQVLIIIDPIDSDCSFDNHYQENSNCCKIVFIESKKDILMCSCQCLSEVTLPGTVCRSAPSNRHFCDDQCSFSVLSNLVILRLLGI